MAPVKIKKRLGLRVKERRKKKRMDTILSQAEEARLSNGLSCIVLDDGRELPDGILRILAEEGRALLRDGTLGRYQTLPFPRMGRRKQLGCLRHLPNG